MTFDTQSEEGRDATVVLQRTSDGFAATSSRKGSVYTYIFHKDFSDCQKLVELYDDSTVGECTTLGIGLKALLDFIDFQASRPLKQLPDPALDVTALIGILQVRHP